MHIAAELPLRHTRNRVVDKRTPEQRLELQLVHLALQLLRALLGLAMQLPPFERTSVSIREIVPTTDPNPALHRS